MSAARISEREFGLMIVHPAKQNMLNSKCVHAGVYANVKSVFYLCLIPTRSKAFHILPMSFTEERI